jgi:dienelactone hydrolase
MNEIKPEDHHFSTPRTARYYSLGQPNPDITDLWIVFHGYGQLARYFIRHFAEIQDAQNWVVAPEALSRFYLGSDYQRIGASWMTREDRLIEIEDQQQYLNGLVAALREKLPGQSVRIHLLGFSQGVATAWRWLMQCQPEVSSFTIWAGRPPEEFSEAGIRLLQKLPLLMVVGEKDPYVKPGMLEKIETHFREKFPHIQRFSFDGGHEMDAATLRKIKQMLS